MEQNLGPHMGAEVRLFRAFRRESLVMETFRRVRVERQAELVAPTELEPRTR